MVSFQHATFGQAVAPGDLGGGHRELGARSPVRGRSPGSFRERTSEIWDVRGEVRLEAIQWPLTTVRETALKTVSFFEVVCTGIRESTGVVQPTLNTWLFEPACTTWRFASKSSGPNGSGYCVDAFALGPTEIHAKRSGGVA